jgi:hypothetical protein
MYWMKGPAQLRNYAEAISEDFRPSEASRRAWRIAFEAWTDRDPISDRTGYGRREIETSFGTIIRYEDMDRERERMLAISRQMDELAPGVRETLRQQKIAALTEDDRRVMTMPEDQRRFKEMMEMMRINQLITVYEIEVATQVPPEHQAKARNLMRELSDGEYRMKQMENYRSTVNYPYWRDFTAMESTVPGVSARQASYDAIEAARQGILEAYDAEETDENGNVVAVRRDGAIDLMFKSFAFISEAIQAYPELSDGESTMVEDLLQDITQYGSYLSIVGREWPDDFPLQWFIDERVRRYGRTNIKNLMTTEDIMARKRELGLLEDSPPPAPEIKTPDPNNPVQDSAKEAEGQAIQGEGKAAEGGGQATEGAGTATEERAGAAQGEG